MDPRVEDARNHYQAIYGEKPPVSPDEFDDEDNSPGHPVDSIMEEARIDVAALLEEDEKDIATDGGYDVSPSMGGPMGPGTVGPNPEYLPDGGEENYSEDGRVIGDLTHVREDIGYEDGAPL